MKRITQEFKPSLVLMGIIVDCPYQPGRKCSQEEINSLRDLPFERAADHIKNMNDEEKERLVQAHYKCSHISQYKDKK